MQVSEEELEEVNKLFKKMNELFLFKTAINSKNYSEIDFYKEKEFRYLNFVYRNIKFEIYFINGQFKYNIISNGNYEKQIIELIKYLKTDFTKLFNKQIEMGKTLSYTFESGDMEEILLSRCRKRNNLL